ncbi:MAG TPA: DUF255 domain-containing protein [Pirellulaceae bacterium]|nr:DUF255 domain-containing protein [Pirellulaceae bacterium]
MKATVRGWLMGCWLAVAWLPIAARGADHMPWCGDFRMACGLAAEQQRLVLLHFTRDNCAPCRKVEAEVFSEPKVAQAVSQNYIPVLVHQARNPDLVTRYQVKVYPTDVMVTSSGLEVYRAISPQKPAEYIMLVNQVAQQTGTSSPRQWADKLAQAAQQSTGGAGDKAAAGASSFAAPYSAAADQTATGMQQMADQAAGAGHAYRQQVVGAAEELHQQAADAAANARQQLAANAQQFQQQSQDAGQKWRQATQQSFDAARGAGQQTAGAAQNLAQSWQQNLSGAADATRSAFVPPGAAAPTLPPTTSAPAVVQPQLPTENPWLTPAGRALLGQQTPPAAPQPDAPVAAPESRPAVPVLESTAPPLVASAPPVETSPPRVESAPAAAAPPAAAPSAAAPPAESRQMVAASQAPPVALDGFCVVSLIESMNWKKADVKYGAIHRGRTYLFVSEEAQQKFLSNPDGFAPVLSGCDPVRFARTGELVAGKRAYGLITPDKRVFLFADEQSLKVFENSPGEYAEAARQAMLRGATGNLYR